MFGVGWRALFVSVLLTASGVVAAQTGADPPTAPTVPVPASTSDTNASPGSVQLESIEITGSRIKQIDFETVEPLTVITRDAIERSGITSTGDLLQRLALAGPAQNTTQGTIFGNGDTYFSLHYLSPQHVLVLVNGRRWVNGLDFYSSSSVDLNTIPISIIERIDILKDGASPVYGSQAVAGVVNIITRKDYSGMELRTQLSTYPASGDGTEQMYGVSLGEVFGLASVFADLSYSVQEGIPASARQVSSVLGHGAGPSRWSTVTPQGRMIFFPGPTVTHPCNRADTSDPADPGSVIICDLTLQQREDGAEQEDFINYDAESHAYNYLANYNLQMPFERTALFGRARYDIADSFSVETELLFRRGVSTQHAAEQVLVIGDFLPPPEGTVYIAADNPYNPFGQDIGRDNGGNGSGIIFRRMVELGKRLVQANVDTAHLSVTLGGELDVFEYGGEWQASTSFTDSNNDFGLPGTMDYSRLRLAIGPLADCQADIDCVPVNLLGGQGPDGTGSITREMANYIIYSAGFRQRQRLVNHQAFVSHPVVDVPFGTVEAAYGVEFRNEIYREWRDATSQGGDTNIPGLPSAGRFGTREAFAEFKIPLLAELPFADSLNLSLAARTARHTSFGTATVYKGGLRWQPTADLMVRTTYGTAFRAPAISELFRRPENFIQFATDPCSDYTGAQPMNDPKPQTVQDNCAEDGVLPTYEDPGNPIGQLERGNPDLRPEEGRTQSVGVVFNPGAVPDLSISLDWYRVELRNYITWFLQPSDVLDPCYERSDRSETCDLIVRGPDGSLQHVTLLPLNVPGLRVETVDLGLGYRLPHLPGAGQFGFRLDATFLHDAALRLESLTAGPPERRTSGTYDPLSGAMPRWKANAQVSWTAGQWQADWTVRYIHAISETCDDGLEDAPTFAELGLCTEPNFDDPSKSRNELKAAYYHGARVAYDLPGPAVSIALGGLNLLDQKPPEARSAPLQNFDVNTYEISGRVVYLQLKKEF